MLAIMSDVHANYDAFEAVLSELEALSPDRVISLGDIVGYGPEPARCIDATREVCCVSLCGNHDRALVFGADDFNLHAQEAIDYHRQQLMPRLDGTAEDASRVRRWNYLKQLSYRYVEGPLLFVHGSPRNPTREYLRQADVRLGLTAKLKGNFDLVEWLSFVGHTHRAGVITEDFKFQTPQELGHVFVPQQGQKAIINVGSVGQPRDRDARASFVTVDEDRSVRFHRVAYDVEAAISKMRTAGAFDMVRAERLRSGQ